jgi:hypothetical protein
MIRRLSVVAMSLVVLAAGLGSSGCSATAGGLGKAFSALLPSGPPSQVQLLQGAADADDAIRQLGELVLEWQDSSHKLHQQGITPRASDDAVQNAAGTFADLEEKASAAIHASTTLGELSAAVAPVVGAVSTIRAALKPYAGLSPLAGTAKVLSTALAASLDAGKKLVDKLEGLK